MDISSPISIIAGDSGTGRSTLHAVLSSRSHQIDYQYKFKQLDHFDEWTSLEDYIKRYTGDVIGFTDNLDADNLPEMNRLVEYALKYNANLLLITRDPIPCEDRRIKRYFIASDDGFRHVIEEYAEHKSAREISRFG